MRFITGMPLIILLFACCLLSADDVQESPDIEWKAIIAYFPGSPLEVSGDWNWFLDDISTHFNEDTVFHLVQFFTGDDTNISLVSPDEELIAFFDISEYSGDYAGYIFIMKDRDPLWCDYDQSYIVIEKAEAYFFGEAE